MKFLKGLASFLSGAGNQLVHSDNMWKYEPDKREIHITNKCREQMKRLGIGQARVMDTYYNGFMYAEKKLVKEYPGYQLGVFYLIRSDNGRIMITWVWKKEVR